MPFELEPAQALATLAISVLTILGIIFGWFGKVWRGISKWFKPKPSVGTVEIPSKTMILMPLSKNNALWWHMGSKGDEPGMQIVGDLHVTNISKVNVYITSAKIRGSNRVFRRLTAVGNVMVASHGYAGYAPDNPISMGTVSELRFDFFVQPPVRKKGKPFKADIAIIDQFENEHWLKGLEFPYT